MQPKNMSFFSDLFNSSCFSDYHYLTSQSSLSKPHARFAKLNILMLFKKKQGNTFTTYACFLSSESNTMSISRCGYVSKYSYDYFSIMNILLQSPTGSFSRNYMWVINVKTYQNVPWLTHALILLNGVCCDNN